MDLKCFSCGTANAILEKVGFRAECEKCGADLHVCKNCHFYDPKVYNECRETSAEVIREKERANYCEYFQPGNAAGGDSKMDALRAAAEALFKKGGS